MNERMTDEELTAIEARKTEPWSMHGGCTDYYCDCHLDAKRLVAEVRRLRELRSLDDPIVAAQAATIARLRVEHAADLVVIETHEATIRLLKRDSDRLRSDEWLEKAATEITENTVPLSTISGTIDQRVAILRKHRDGKA